jgi:DNA-binding transcriptional ArsR family regulator
VSPLGELCSLLRLVACSPPAASTSLWVTEARSAIVGHELELLGSLAAPGYLPDFLTPEPRQVEPSIEEELHALTATPASRVRAELQLLRDGRPRSGLSGRPLPAALAAALESGEAALLDRLAEEASCLWQATLAGPWPRLRSALRAEVARAAGVQADYGAGVMLADLHPGVTWDEPVLEVRCPYRFDVGWARTVVITPSVVSPGVGAVIDPLIEAGASMRDPMLAYQMRSLAAASTDGVHVTDRPARPAAVVEALLGASRAALLEDLFVARTTSELSTRHHLTPSAVSYHLGILHRAGLLRRWPERDRVFYECSALGRAIADSRRDDAEIASSAC